MTYPKTLSKRLKVLGLYLTPTWKYFHQYLNKHGITYNQYLKSAHWKKLRARKLQIYKERMFCWACRKNRNKYPNLVLHLHHKTYKRIGKERLTDVVWLCKGCHKTVHNNLKQAQTGPK